jgi:hypothetical protein
MGKHVITITKDDREIRGTFRAFRLLWHFHMRFSSEHAWQAGRGLPCPNAAAAGAAAAAEAEGNELSDLKRT